VSLKRRCDDDEIAALVAGTLPPDEVSRLSQHFTECARCRAIHDQLVDDDDALSDPSLFIPRGGVEALLEYIEKAQSEDDLALALLDELLSEPAESWRAFVAADPRFRRVAIVRRIIDLTQSAYRSHPARAMELARLAVDIAEMIPSDGMEATRTLCIAWRKYANAAAKLGDYLEAKRALDLADSNIGYWPDADREAATNNLARAIVYRYLARYEEAADLLATAKRVFRKYGDQKLYADSVYTEALLHYSINDYPKARSIFTPLVEQMRLAGDREMEAGLHFMIGHCHAHEGDEASAINCWARAKVLFDRCRMHSDKARMTQAIGRMRIRRGEIECGLADLREAEAAFEEFAMRGDAIDVGLEIVEALHDHGGSENAGEIVERCRQLISRAEAAGLARQSAVAIAYLHKAAKDGELTADFVRHVRHFLADVKLYPNLEFDPRGSTK
jgi:tetratricopeptide (TPR) repeat protein